MSSLPHHIAFIMDGNRRWAQQQHLEKKEGHQQGTITAETVVRWCVKKGIPYITLYTLSTDNIKKRSVEELKTIFSLLKTLPEKRDLFIKNKIALHIIGKQDDLPKTIQNLLTYSLDLFSNIQNPLHHLTLAINYGGKEEILSSVKTCIHERIPSQDISEQIFENFLYTKNLPDVDLIVRTGGDHRLSGFMLWKSSYAEIYFTDILWPDFDEKNLEEALTFFKRCKRNFGK